ncbi:MAG: PCMD domain-containing protein [Bacteroidales bacterium]
MKTLYTSLFLLMVFKLSAFSQTVPNSSFENWVTTGNYSNPEFWSTPNNITSAIPIIGAPVVTKSSGGHTGSWSAKLENKNFIIYTIPGIMTLGTLSIDLANFEFGLTGGVPYNERPDVFRGFYKFSPQGGDTCAFLAIFYKHNTNGGQDTIGLAYFLDNTARTTWTEFETPIDWFTSDIPDTMNIIVSSAASFDASSGTVLYVDDLSFDYYTAIPETKVTDPIQIDYSRLSKNINVHLSLTGESKVSTRVVNLTGQTVRSLDFSLNGTKTVNIPMDDMPKGLYIVDVRAGENKMVRKIVLN